MQSRGSNYSLISPPTTPPPPPPAACRRGSISSGSKRPRPYPAVSLYTMSNSPAYQWSRTHPVERKPTDGDKLAAYAPSPQFISVSNRH